MRNPQPEFIVIGTVLSPWGIHGRMQVVVETDFPQRFSPSSEVYIGGKSFVIGEVNWHKGRAIIGVAGIDREEEAKEMAGLLVEIHSDQLYDLGEDEYYHFQLVGLTAKTPGGDVLGEITGVLSMASADIYVIGGRTGEILVPATDEYVKSVDLEQGVLIVEPVEGLLDLNAKKPK
jgi:16S rRNA processing protein RimM